MKEILVKRGDLKHIKASIELGEYGKALDVLEEILKDEKGEG